jgi:CRISPR-associated endonuclease/helicase Cas3
MTHKYYAHSLEGRPPSEWQLLEDHLKNVAQMAREFAESFGAEDLGWCAGLLHDIGKIHPDFQEYLEEEKARRGSVDHSSAGAVLADTVRNFYVSWVVAGHHGGLAGKASLKSRLKEKSKISSVKEVIELVKKEMDWHECASSVLIPKFIKDECTSELFIRMLFSCLVDADYLDTESFLNKKREKPPEVNKLLRPFLRNQNIFSSSATNTSLNQIRNEVYKHCIMAAKNPSGVFKLTVPTGGGKTRSSLGFALEHTIINGHDRIIYALPYTSIIEQTVTVFRDILGKGNVLEHHSGVQLSDNDRDDDTETPEETMLRLASENWDFPLVVTTTVQLFESLFSNRPGRCRKLHNIARSIIILDEVQTLPSVLIRPIVSGLKELVHSYGVSVVLCTATQPALSGKSRYLSGFENVTNIIPDKAESQYFEELKRVEYVIADEPWSWERAAGEMRKEKQALAIVNTRKDALALLEVLDDRKAFHLSTLLCGKHRRDVLEEVRERLKDDRECRLVSTQVIEAGVDVDFPLVLRALGPLDRIVQAAGRCNREGKIEKGRVVVFEPEDGRSPRGPYRTALMEAKNILEKGDVDLHDPSIFEEYFGRLFIDVNTDAKKIGESRKAFDFPEVARKFRMIEEESIPVVVNYPRQNGPYALIEEVRRKGRLSRSLWRRLQPFFVNIYCNDFEAYENKMLIEQSIPGLYLWRGGYDEIKGISEIARDPSDLIV